MNRLNIVIGAVMLFIVIGIGLYIKSLNDQVVTCKANTSIQKNRYDDQIKSYDTAIIDITRYYDTQIDGVTTFQRRTDETDCEAAKRFLNTSSY